VRIYEHRVNNSVYFKFGIKFMDCLSIILVEANILLGGYKLTGKKVAYKRFRRIG